AIRLPFILNGHSAPVNRSVKRNTTKNSSEKTGRRRVSGLFYLEDSHSFKGSMNENPAGNSKDRGRIETKARAVSRIVRSQ
ncbi:MAG: hypothetical protein LC776_18200, partial [Acidobacteria bacterium]|nr:hypothetical protein [Acidobacteriota bacterium]